MINTSEARKVVRSSMSDSAKLIYFVKKAFNCTTKQHLIEVWDKVDMHELDWALDQYEHTMGQPLFAKTKRKLSRLRKVRKVSITNTTLDLVKFYQTLHFKYLKVMPKVTAADFRILKNLKRKYPTSRVEKEMQRMFAAGKHNKLTDLKKRMDSE